MADPFWSRSVPFILKGCDHLLHDELHTQDEHIIDVDQDKAKESSSDLLFFWWHSIVCHQQDAP